MILVILQINEIQLRNVDYNRYRKDHEIGDFGDSPDSPEEGRSCQF